jgi:hypothetical protein
LNKFITVCWAIADDTAGIDDLDRRVVAIIGLEA